MTPSQAVFVRCIDEFHTYGTWQCLTWRIDILDRFLNMHDPWAVFVLYVDEFGTNWTWWVFDRENRYFEQFSKHG